MEQLKSMKEMLVSCVQGQMTHLDSVDTKELGEAIDMIKDLAEAIYYCTITEAMKEKGPQDYREEGRDYPYGGREGGGRRNYGGVMPYPYYPDEEYYRDMDKMKGRMYYNGNGNNGGTHSSSGGNVSSGSTSGNSGTRGYSERPMQFEDMMRDQREGRSGQSRKMYMESKEMHKDKTIQLQELEKYAQELTADLMEMIQDATPEEKQHLSNRIATLATKIK